MVLDLPKTFLFMINSSSASSSSSCSPSDSFPSSSSFINLANISGDCDGISSGFNGNLKERFTDGSIPSVSSSSLMKSEDKGNLGNLMLGLLKLDSNKDLVLAREMLLVVVVVAVVSVMVDKVEAELN
ncbi:hypothetical protein WICPIJ_008269 [Wickerhamomyces pijperi]|uniref:Uncharacterized protein n=1 Tax=Wickerhamomyces pijperi TaxID=599730 RepID=A0A9P8PXS0_WICPI|nr:hypothetical protein WICPIJ_008269 [Wickerhamomyces pijperi]